MKTLLLALVLIAAPVAFAGSAAAAPDPLPDWTCIPESPCCDTLVCLGPPEPCRVGNQYIC